MSEPKESSAAIEQHYGNSASVEDILQAFVAAGFDIDNLKPADLSRIDQLHMGGQKATLELAREVNITPDMKVLDIGSGIGGTPRLLAMEYGCHVTGVDLTQTFCETAEALTRFVGLDDRVATLHANALGIPLDDDCFDLIWCQHAQMNIPDKEGLIREFTRLLKKGGKLALHEVFVGKGDAPTYPVPWAVDASTSYLVGCDEWVEWLKCAGFSLVHHKEVSQEAQQWWAKLAVGIKKQGGSALGPRLIFGDKSRQFGPNVVQNLDRGSIAVYELIFEYLG